MSDLIEKLKLQIIEKLNLEDVEPDDIENNQALFGPDGFGLDSIDALEFIVLLDEVYGIKIQDPEEGKKIFYSVNTLAEYIQKNSSIQS